MAGRYEHVAFDLDGTLVDSRADLTAAVNFMLRSFALDDLPLETVCKYVGEGARRLVERALGGLHRDRLEDGLKCFLDYYGAHVLDCTRAYPGIPESLAALTSRGVVLSVLTNKPAAMSLAILDGLRLRTYFRVVVGGDSLAARKPDPAGLEYIRRLTATRADCMLMVGDSPIDLETARAAGVAFCGVAWGLRPGDLRAARPALMIEQPSDLLAVVGLR